MLKIVFEFTEVMLGLLKIMAIRLQRFLKLETDLIVIKYLYFLLRKPSRSINDFFEGIQYKEDVI